MEYPKLNEELFERVIRHILEEPRRFQMEKWADKSDKAPCGTVACIGGWAVALDQGVIGPKLHEMTFMEPKAAKALGIGESETMELFFATRWPDRFKYKYLEAPTDDDAAEAAVARIRAFIEDAKARRVRAGVQVVK